MLIDTLASELLCVKITYQISATDKVTNTLNSILKTEVL